MTSSLPIKIKDKNILITGAGSGIGRAMAQSLAQKGFRLILLGRQIKKLQETQEGLRDPFTHECYACDIRDAQGISKALLSSRVNSLYAVIANAGVAFENIYGEGDKWKEVIDINLTGNYLTIQECLPYLKKNDKQYKKIVLISSLMALFGEPRYSAYCASKAAMLGLMRSLAVELSKDNILVNAICPGWVNTEMAHEGLKEAAKAWNISYEEMKAIAMKDVPLGKMSEPTDIAALVSFLIQEDQASITGQTLNINDGALMP
jgi:NAD(P)-dependent dehydrogenase (short-subunit alcohol dehydrogenase family)